MGLSAEDKKRIYEEEKARLQAREQIEREMRQETASKTTTGFTPSVAGLICYIGAWVTGIIIFILEQKNDWIRFHAAQSIVVFGTLTLAGAVLFWIPFVGGVLITIISILAAVLWLILMFKAYNGESYKLVWAGDIAERMVAMSSKPAVYQNPATSAPKAAESATAPAPVQRSEVKTKK